MTIDAFPTLVTTPSNVELAYLAATGSMRTYGGPTSEGIFPGALWSQILRWEIIDGISRGALSAFLARQEGSAGRFTCPVFDYMRLGGQDNAPIIVSAAGQVGPAVLVSGLAGIDPVLRAGDMCRIGTRHLHIVTRDVNRIDGQIRIKPDLYESPVAGSEIYVNGYGQSGRPTLNPVWQLVDNDALRRVTRSPLISAITVSMVTAPNGNGI